MAKKFVLTLLLYSVAMPTGWCCYVPTMASSALRTGDVASDDESPCCCCKPKPQPSPTRTPTDPGPKRCCCEPVPSVVTHKVEFDDMACCFLQLSPDTRTMVEEPLGDVVARPPISRPSLHLLYCVWTC